MLDRRQIILLTIFAASWILVGIGLAGAAIPGVPRSVSSAVGVTGVLGVGFFIPGTVLYGMLRKDRVAAARSHALASRWRWRFAIGGGWATLAGTSLLLENTQYRIAGAVALAWGVLCLLILGLSVRQSA